MSKKIRSISIAEKIDEQLQEDSDYRGLTISYIKCFPTLAIQFASIEFLTKIIKTDNNI